MGHSVETLRLIAAGTDRTEELHAIMAERILVLDGATGTIFIESPTPAFLLS